MTTPKTKRQQLAKKKQHIHLASLLLATAAFLLPYIIHFEGLTPQGHRIFGIFLMAIVLWVSEAIPLHATAALIIFTQILLISDKAILPLPDGFIAPQYSTFYHALAHPVLMLFLGGFFLAEASAKYTLDRNLARVLLKPFGTSPKRIMLGLMLITAILSMFMSNTATTATMMAVLLPVTASLKLNNKLRTSLALCIPVAANTGGLGTPVGSPPNAIALGALSDAGINITFVEWMIIATPFMLIILVAAWLILYKLFPSNEDHITLTIDSTFNLTRPAIIFYITFALTIILWLTEPLHHIKSTIVGFLPVVILLSTGVFTTKDMQSIQWHVLWLVAGGIALGSGVNATGLDRWLISLVNWENIAPSMVGALLCLVTLIMSTVISNSASANLLIPIGLSLATSGTVALSPILASVFIAIGASLAMALPISTPPNAIAYSTGLVQTKNMAKIGLLVGLIGLTLFVLIGPPLWKILGVAGG